MKLLWLALFLFPQLLWAQRPGVRVVERPQQGVLVHAAWDVRFERDENQNLKDRHLPTLGAGYFYDVWLGEFEYGSFSQSSGNAALSVTRKFESAMAWFYWQPKDFNQVAPFFGGGLGGIREAVETTLTGVTDSDHSDWSFTTGAAAGARILPKGKFWLSAEGRIYKNPRLDPDPMFGVLARIGWILF